MYSKTNLSPFLAVLSLRGSDAASFIQGYLTTDVTELETDCAYPTALTNLAGRVVSNGWVYGESSTIHLVIHDSVVEKTREHLRKYLLFAKSRFDSEVMQAGITDQAIAEGISLMPFRWRLQLGERTEADLWHLFVKEKFPLVTESTSASFLPQMLGITQHGAVSFTKGCYLGQEIVARTEYRGTVKRQLQTYGWSGETIYMGEKVTGENSQTGIVVGFDDSLALVVTTGQPKQLRGKTSVLWLESDAPDSPAESIES